MPVRLDRYQVFPASDWEEELIKIKDIGYGYAELLFDSALRLEKLLLGSRDLEGFISESGGSGPEINSACVDYLSSVELMDPETGGEYFNKVTGLIGMFGGTTVNTLVLPLLEINTLRSAGDFKLVLDRIGELNIDSAAAEKNITLALELSLPAAEIRATMSEYEFDNIKLCYDLGNARAMGFVPEDDILLLKDLIAHVHIKDRKINGSNVALGEGDVNFEGSLRSLKDIGYDGIMILETCYSCAPVNEARKNLEFVNAILKRIEE